MDSSILTSSSLDRTLEPKVLSKVLSLNIYFDALKILAEKKEQEFSALEKVKPQSRNILNRLITDFDLDNSSFKIVNKYSIGKKEYLSLEDKENFIRELKDLLILREMKLKNWVESINGT